MTDKEIINTIFEIVNYNCKYLNPYEVPGDVVNTIITLLADVHSIGGDGKQMIWETYLKNSFTQYYIGSHVISETQRGMLLIRLSALGFGTATLNRHIKVFVNSEPFTSISDSTVDAILRSNNLIKTVDYVKHEIIG